MSTYSSDLRIELIANGAQAGTWGTTTNDTWAYVIDPAITGFQTVAVSSANQALTYVSGSTATASANQAIYASLAFTTSTGASFNVYAPPAPKQYIIWNNSSYTLTIYNSTVIGNTTAAGAGAAIPAGKKVQVFSDGTNFYTVDASNLTGTLAIANGGTGQTTQQAAINALAGATTSAQFLRGNGTNVVMSAIQVSDVPTLNQNTSGTAAGLSATLAVGSGGTGQTTQQAAINALAGATTSGYYLRGNGTNVSMSAIQAADVPTLNQNTTGSAGSVANAVTFNNGGSGDASGTTFNGSAARTVSYNTVGAPSTSGANASGTWGISISGTAALIADGSVSTSAKIVDGVVTPAKLSQPYTLSTAQNTTSGTSIDFTSIPSWVKRVTIMLNGVSTSGSSNPMIQIGAGSITATGYNGGMWYSGGGATNSTGFQLSASAAGDTRYGILTLETLGSNLWVLSGTMYIGGPGIPAIPGGSITLSGTLDRIRLTTVGGTDTFDAGSMNISYE